MFNFGRIWYTTFINRNTRPNSIQITKHFKLRRIKVILEVRFHVLAHFYRSMPVNNTSNFTDVVLEI